MVRRFGILAVVSILASLMSFASSAPQVKTKSGTVEGKEEGSVRAFLGIPYAQPAAGELRWKAPVPVAKWSGVKKTTDFGPHCMQGRVYDDMKFRDSGGSEDCLTLNVWAPSNPPSKKLPVMVWIYGGGFVAGTTSEARQDGTHLAQQGVIVVSMNYRLGVFGFMVHPELAKESGRNSAGNYGLLDQLEALKWVHDNIGAFGGDPGNVTIFGESAGSFSVSAQMASPLAKGLFQKAIGESGALLGASLPAATLAKTEANGVEFAKSLGASSLAEMRAKSAADVLAAATKPGGGIRFSANIDGYFIPQSPLEIYASGKQAPVPLLAGWNADEQGPGGLFGRDPQ